MNTKLIRSTLVLAVCLLATAAQAITVKTLPKPGKVPHKVQLPHIPSFKIGHPKGVKASWKGAVRPVKEALSPLFSGKSFEREMDALALNIQKSIDAQSITGEQIKRPPTQIFATQDGTVLSREAGFRDIYLPGVHPGGKDPSASQQLRRLYPNADKLPEQFDGRASYELLLHSMPREILEKDPTAGDLLRVALHVYELVAKDQYVLNHEDIKNLPITWRVDLAIMEAQLKVFDKIYRVGLLSDGFRKDVPFITESILAQDFETIPGFFDAVNAVTFTEYMVKENNLNFPFFGKDKYLNKTIVTLWRKLWTNELSPEIGQFLLKDYMYAPNARNIGAVIDAVYEDYLLDHKFPGINFGADAAVLETFCDNVGKEIFTPTTEELFDYQLGQEVVLLVRTLPESPFWEGLDQITKLKVETMRDLLEGGLEKLEAQADRH